jgi:hypothetical protein
MTHLGSTLFCANARIPVESTGVSSARFTARQAAATDRGGGNCRGALTDVRPPSALKGIKCELFRISKTRTGCDDRGWARPGLATGSAPE